MKLAEALILRADRKERFEQLRSRAQAIARYQEGEQPPEDANALVQQAQEVLDEFEDLIRRINLTNSSSAVASGATLTAALAERDVLRLRYSLLTSVADAASGKGQVGRHMRSELKFLAAVPVPELRERANEVAKRHRELDTEIQGANWTVDLVEE
jgi:hypothetical protein